MTGDEVRARHGVDAGRRPGQQPRGPRQPAHDLHPTTDYPRYYPGHRAPERTIDNAPASTSRSRAEDVIGVSALGPSERKADYSNYTTDLTTGEIEVSAPGGWYRDGLGTDTYRTNGNLILSAAPLNVLQDEGEVDKNGEHHQARPDLGVLKSCVNGKYNENTSECAYYQWLQGTSMASPHATGVAALAVAAHGTGTRRRTSGSPRRPRRAIVMDTRDRPRLPRGRRAVVHRRGPRPRSSRATCVGTADFNGFYGDGIVNALAAVQ